MKFFEWLSNGCKFGFSASGYLKGLELIYKHKQDSKNDPNHPEHWRWQGKGKDPRYRDPDSYCGHLRCPQCKKENLESDVFIVIGMINIDEPVFCTNGHSFRTSKGRINDRL